MTRILTDPSPSSEHWQHRNQPQDWPCYRPSDLTMTWKLWCQGSFAPLRCFYICYIFHFLNPGNILLMKAKTRSQGTRSVLFLHPIVNTIAIAIIVHIAKIIISLLLQLLKLSLQSKWLPLTSFMQTQEALGEMLGDLLVHSCIRWLRSGNAES